MSIDRRILIADDDAGLRAGFAELLGGLGLEIVEAENGGQALEIVRTSIALGNRLDLAVLDMHMPEATGLEVLESIVEQALAIPCILCSGQAGDDVMRMAQSRGAHAVFRKPVEPLVLRQEVLRALGLDGDPHGGSPGHNASAN